jgi:glycosyltransferase involved in cell wall biosynthesis
MKNDVTDEQRFQNSRILFVYADNRAKYLLNELEHNNPRIDSFKIEIDVKKPFFLKNILLCIFEILFPTIKNDTPINKRMLYYNSVRRPDFIKRLSSLVEKHVNSMSSKPEMILQWQAIFAPYVKAPEIPFVLIIDNYTNPPDSANQKEKLRGWSTFYDKSFFAFQKELYNKAEKIFTLSKWCKEGLSREYGIDSEKIVSIGWGPAADVSVTNVGKKENKSIVAIGKDYRAKGIDILLEVAKYLPDFEISIIGKDPSFKPTYPKNVNICDHLTNAALADIYQKSEFFFIFSEFDPSPHVIWEAQAFGCIIIGFDAYGISEAVANDKSGLLLKTRDPKTIAIEIRKLQTDDALMERMQNGALENYRKNGTWAEVSKKIIQNL